MTIDLYVLSYIIKRIGRCVMKVKSGDVLVCSCKDCNVELTVTNTCDEEKCGIECDVNATCCDEPMVLKK